MDRERLQDWGLVIGFIGAVVGTVVLLDAGWFGIWGWGPEAQMLAFVAGYPVGLAWLVLMLRGARGDGS